MVDQAQSVTRRRAFRRNAVKANDSNKTNDDLESGLLCPYQLIFLIETTLNSTKYIDVYKDAVEGMHRTEDQACNVVIIDHNRIVESLDNNCVEQDEQYRSLHDRAKRYFHNNSRVSNKLMVLLVRQTIIINLESMRQKFNFDTEPYTFQPAVVNIILINFIDLELMIEFITSKIKVDAIVELSCGEIAQTRDKFVSRPFRAKQAMAVKAIQKFWRDFHMWLDTADGASVFKNVVVYQYKSKYNAEYEPPNVDKMLVAARLYVLHEMHRVLLFVYNVRAEYEKYTQNNNPVYALPVNDDDSMVQHYYESYTKHLKGYPEDAIELPTILDAMVKAAIAGPVQPPTERWVDAFFGALKDDSDDGCMVYPACVQYGNKFGLVAKKHDLRHTDYFDSAVNVLNVRWRKSLWGSCPLPPSDVEAEHDRVISHIKRKCEHHTSGDDVDVQLCALALNRLRSNLDIYRGEPIGLPGLSMTNVKFQPELIEPAGCATMVQMLQKESESYRRMSHAYFEPEDVVVVGFYDCQKVLQTRKSSFRFNVPQRPVFAKDYFDLHYGKRTPKCFYAMDTATAASDMSLTYTEEIEEIRFKDDDFLRISERKWRFEPSTVSLVHKSGYYEIVKHVKSVDDDHQRGGENEDEDDDDDDHPKNDEDWLRVYNNDAGLEYYVGKTRKNVIRCIGQTSWAGIGGGCTVELISGNDPGYGMLQQIYRRRNDVDGAKVNAAEVEMCRFYGNGRVVAEYADRTKVTYWSSGKIQRPSRSTRTPLQESSKSSTGRPRASTISSDSTEGGPTKIEPSKSVSIKAKKSQARRTTKSVTGMGRSPSRMRRKKSTISPSGTSENNKNNDPLQDPRMRRHADYVERFSEDGATRTVEFADGTCIVGATNVRRSSTVVPPYEYIHPAYHTVTEDPDGTFKVTGVCTMSRGLAGGPVGLRLTDRSMRIDATTDAVYVYRSDDDGDDDERLTATFGWNGSEFLFEKRVNAVRVVTVPRKRQLGDDLVLGMTGATMVTTEEAESASECFVVRRGMSGFRTLDSLRYEQFADGVRGRQHTAVRESQRVRTVTVFAAHDVDVEKPWVTGPPAVAIGEQYAWLRPFSGKVAALDDERVPTTIQLTSRSFRKVNIDYGPLIEALMLQQYTGSGSQATVDVPPGKLRVRVYVPDVDALRKIYSPGDSRNLELSSSRRDSAAAHDERLSAKLAHLKQERCDALEARSLMRQGRFVPFFHADDFGPLRTHLKANGL
ncbi:unnamed protein product [Macrosiphum euphorbiae]|uniref:Uncharacterized protein n=1 Tax=Macrosiphum euphorbiae TaxID=13131 RepID=A0AAV0WFN3_9HEMI|nr:unnamed protein product [Macrosiphum euphorbiae]